MQRKIPRIRRFPMSEVGPEVAVFVFLSIGSVALFSFVAVASWANARRKEREAYYKNDALKKIAESPAPSAAAALEYLREQHRNTARRRHEGMKLGGLITTAVGLALLIFLWKLVGPPIHLAALIPLLVGLVLIGYAYSAAKE
jgi:Flp pilus assembly protein TadB